ncbi:MAG: hypothetical protein KA764_17000 [Anaerolineales bacterium]|nr:hypothetical protein [Anaerolineales bacterium]
MPQLRWTVTEIATFSGHCRVRCASAAAPAPGPGQFYLVTQAESILPTALFPTPAGPAGVEFWVDTGQPLTALTPAAELEVAGPLGRVIAWPARTTRLLLVAASLSRVWPALIWALGRGWSVTWLWPEGVPDDVLDILPPAVEIARGPVTPDLAEWADTVLLDGPAELAGQVRALAPLRSAEAVLAYQVPPLPCGFGGCQACWVETRRGRRLACVDGPVLPL